MNTQVTGAAFGEVLLGRQAAVARQSLLRAAQTAVAAYPGADDQARRARSLLPQTYQVTACLLLKLYEFDLA
jgi:homoserine kinase